MTRTAGLMQSLVPITQFNKGRASQIFARLASERQLVVLKNNSPSAIILSPEEYERLAEIEENYRLMTLAQERLAQSDGTTISLEQVMSRINISQADLDALDEVEFE